METTTIRNPETGRQVQVRAWRVEPRAIRSKMRAGEIKSAKDISWMLLNDDASIQEMRDEEHGDSARTNWALAVFEHGLDWSLGIAVLRIMNAAIETSHLPKPFDVMVNRSGVVFVHFPTTGRVIKAI